MARDLFWGRGSDAELAASEMKQLGELYFLVPRPARRVAAARPRPLMRAHGPAGAARYNRPVRDAGPCGDGRLGRRRRAAG